MGQLGLGGAGAAIGGAIGSMSGSALLGAQLGFTLGLMLFGLFGGEKVTIEGSRLDDLDITTSTYGKSIPLIYGTKRVGGNVFWATDLIEHRHQETNTEGGKGKGGKGTKVVTVTYTYTTSFALGLCAGPMSCVLKIWADGKLIANLSGDDEPLTNEVLNVVKDPKEVWTTSIPDALGVTPTAQLFLPGLRIYLGGEEQQPDPAIMEDVGIDNTPAYRGLCYIVFQDMLLTDFGNRIPQITCQLSHPTCVDAFPFTTLDTATARESGGKWEQGSVFFSDDFKTGCVVDSNRIIHIDLVTHQIIKEVPFDPDGLPVIYADPKNTSFYITRGFCVVFGFTHILTCDGTIWIVDINTGETIADSGFGTQEKPCDTKAHIQDGNRVYHWGNAGGGQYEVVNVSNILIPPPPLAPTPNVVMAHQNISISLASLGFGPSIGINAIKGAFIRNDGRCWVNWVDGPDLIFLEYNDDGIPSTQRSITGTVLNNASVYYDNLNDVIVGWDAKFARRYSLPDLTLLHTDPNPVGTAPSVGQLHRSQKGMPFGGQAIWGDGGGDGRYDIYNMTEILPRFDATNWASPLSDPMFYSPIDHSIMTAFPDGTDLMYWLYLDRGDAGTEPVSDVITDISNRVGLSASDIDVTDLTTDTVHGFIIGNQSPAKNALETLMRPYFFDVIETDFIIDFQKRGGASVKSIPEIDLGAASPGGNKRFRITENREQEFEKFPAVVSFVYADKDEDDLKNTQIWRRAAEAIHSKYHMTFSLPMVFPNSAARNIVEVIGAQLWFQRTKYTTTLTWEHIDLNPADLVTLNFDGAVIEALIIDLSYGLDGVIQADLISENPSVYTRTAQDAAALGVPQQKVQLLSTPEGIVADMQPLRTQDLDLDYYTVAFRRSPAALYSGADFYDSADQANWESIGVMLRSEEAIGGYTIGKLAAPAKGHTIIDRINTVKLKATTGSLSSTTESVMLDGTTNVIVIENSVGWEIISFENATLEITGTYTIDTLIRGRKGTEAYMAGHNFGNRWFIPTVPTVRNIEYSSALLGTNRFHRTIAIGESSIENAGLTKSITPVGRRIRPLSPSVDEGYTNSTGDIIGRWRRKGRGAIFQAAHPFDNWQPDFSSISYEVDFINLDSSVARTVTQTASANGSVITMPADEFTGNVTLHYDTVDITADSFDGTTFICYQLNDSLSSYNSGRGEPSTIIIDERS